MQTYRDVEWDEMRRDIELLHAENALKLTQILDLEQLLWDVRIMEDKNGVPCWMEDCHFPPSGKDTHGEKCLKARQATEMFWKK